MHTITRIIGRRSMLMRAWKTLAIAVGVVTAVIVGSADTLFPTMAVEAAQPDLSITKTVSQSSATPGDVVTYTITVKNIGAEDVNNVVVSDTLPADLSFVSGIGRTRTWSVATLGVGESSVQTVDVRVESDAKKGDHVSVATAVADKAEQKQAVAAITVRLPKVLGVAQTLAATGTTPFDYAIFLIGALLAGLGFWGMRNLRLAARRISRQ